MYLLIYVIIQLALIVRVMLRPDKDPASRIAWIAVIATLPVLGFVAYWFLGETNIGRDRLARSKRVKTALPDLNDASGYAEALAAADIPEARRSLFRVGESISGFAPVGGNRAELMADSNSAIDRMVADIDAARKHVHLSFYIWLPDHNGGKMAEALKRAVARGVTCRAMIDDIGSHDLTKSDIWRDLQNSGVEVALAMPVRRFAILHALSSRIDLRDHRKILVVDDDIAYCGSQNCADPEFLPKAKYAPWVDCVMRLTGPVARQNQMLFADNWMASTGDDLRECLTVPVTMDTTPGIPAQVVATGPTGRSTAMPEMFVSLMYDAQRSLTITTPYFVPVDSMHDALCAAAHRGVDTKLVLPARNDDFAVAATSRSYFAELLDAGVRVFEFGGGLLHSKTLTLDEEMTLIGSANMDRRSFELNYENNVLLYDVETTKLMIERQQQYIADSREVKAEEVAAWPWPTRLWHNACAIVGPVL